MGDEFMYRNFQDHFQQRSYEDYQGYAKEHFETRGFANSKYISTDQNMLSRLRNLMVKAISDQILFPKYIVIVLDDDLIKFLNHEGYGITKSLGWLINNLMIEYDRLIETQKEYLSYKSKKSSHPILIWIEAPLHNEFDNNSEHLKFNKCLQEKSLFRRNMVSLHLKKVWDPSNKNYYLGHSQRFTTAGMDAYWTAIDRTIKYSDTILYKKVLQRNKKQTSGSDAGNNQGRPASANDANAEGYSPAKNTAEKRRKKSDYNRDRDRKSGSPIPFRRQLPKLKFYK